MTSDETTAPAATEVHPRRWRMGDPDRTGPATTDPGHTERGDSRSCHTDPDRPDRHAGSRQRAVSFARGLVVLAALVPVGLYVYVALHRLGYPYELEWMEGGALEIVRRVVAGHQIYVQPSLHYVPYAYPPLYFWVSAGLAHVTGVSFLPLRLVSFASSIGSLGLIYHLVRSETEDRVAGMVGVGVFAATFTASDAWFDIARVDSLFVLLLLASVAVARRARSARGGMVVGLLVCGAFLTKQTALVAVLPLLGYLVVRRPRVGLAGVGIAASGIVLTTVVLDHGSGGWYRYYVFQELLGQGTVPASWTSFFPKDLLAPTGWAVALGLGGLLAAVRNRALAWPFWIATSGGFIGASWLSRVHAGGGQDVLIPAYAAVALLAGLGYESIRRAGARAPVVVTVALTALVAIQVGWLAFSPVRQIPSRTDRVAGDAFVGRVGRLRGPVVVYDHPWYATLAGKAPSAQGEAVNDVLRAGPSRARADLLASINSTLRSGRVRTVFVDDPDEALTLDLQADGYRLGPPVFRCYQCFFPVTDVPLRPYLEYVRN